MTLRVGISECVKGSGVTRGGPKRSLAASVFYIQLLLFY